MKVKYAIAAFHAAYKLKPFSKATYFDDRTFVVTSKISIFTKSDIFDSHWKEWIGSLRWEELNRDCDTLLVTWKETASPDILDCENQQLTSRLFELVRMLPAVTPYCFSHNDHIFSLSGQGKFENERLLISDLREFSAWPTFRKPMFLDPEMKFECPFFEPEKFATDWPNLAAQIESRIMREKNRQLLESYRSLEEAFRTNQLEFKIPNLVRAIECLIDCNGAADFSKKVAKFNGAPPNESIFSLSENYENKLKTLYQLRNDCSHGKEFGWSLQNKTPSEFSKETVAAYECLAEWSARKAFRRALFDRSLGEIFIDRKTLIEGWRNIELDGPSQPITTTERVIL